MAAHALQGPPNALAAGSCFTVHQTGHAGALSTCQPWPFQRSFVLVCPHLVVSEQASQGNQCSFVSLLFQCAPTHRGPLSALSLYQPRPLSGLFLGHRTPGALGLHQLMSTQCALVSACATYLGPPSALGTLQTWLTCCSRDKGWWNQHPGEPMGVTRTIPPNPQGRNYRHNAWLLPLTLPKLTSRQFCLLPTL